MAVFRAISATIVSGTFEVDSLDHSIPTGRLGVNIARTYTSGTGENQANQWWADRRTVAGASENLDVVGGLTDMFGSTISFTAIKELLILNRSTTAAELLLISGTAVGNVMLTPAGGKAIVKAGGIWHQAAPLGGFTVAPDIGDIITVDPTADTITYDIFLIGIV